MPEEFESEPIVYSPFIPLLVFLISFICWIGFQDISLNAQRSFFSKELDTAGPIYAGAQNWHGRYDSVMKDLVETGRKDPGAAAIAKEAIQAGVQAGLVRVNQQAPAPGGTNSTDNPAPPAK